MKTQWAMAMAILFMMGACTSDSVEELFPIDPGACDTIDVSYSMEIEPVIDQNCYQCHSALLNLGNITLEGHSAFKIVVDGGRLLGSVKHELGFSPMPDGGGMLEACDIAKLEAWINAGAPDN